MGTSYLPLYFEEYVLDRPYLFHRRGGAKRSDYHAVDTNAEMATTWMPREEFRLISYGSDDRLGSWVGSLKHHVVTMTS